MQKKIKVLLHWYLSIFPAIFIMDKYANLGREHLGKRCILWKMNDCYRDGDNYDPDGEANNYADDGNNNNGTIATAQPHCLPLIH